MWQLLRAKRNHKETAVEALYQNDFQSERLKDANFVIRLSKEVAVMESLDEMLLNRFNTCLHQMVVATVVQFQVGGKVYYSLEDVSDLDNVQVIPKEQEIFIPLIYYLVQSQEGVEILLHFLNKTKGSKLSPQLVFFGHLFSVRVFKGLWQSKAPIDLWVMNKGLHICLVKFCQYLSQVQQEKMLKYFLKSATLLHVLLETVEGFQLLTILWQNIYSKTPDIIEDWVLAYDSQPDVTRQQMAMWIDQGSMTLNLTKNHIQSLLSAIIVNKALAYFLEQCVHTDQTLLCMVFQKYPVLLTPKGILNGQVEDAFTTQLLADDHNAVSLFMVLRNHPYGIRFLSRLYSYNSSIFYKMQTKNSAILYSIPYLIFIPQEKFEQTIKQMIAVAGLSNSLYDFLFGSDQKEMFQCLQTKRGRYFLEVIFTNEKTQFEKKHRHQVLKLLSAQDDKLGPFINYLAKVKNTALMDCLFDIIRPLIEVEASLFDPVVKSLVLLSPSLDEMTCLSSLLMCDEGIGILLEYYLLSQGRECNTAFIISAVIEGTVKVDGCSIPSLLQLVTVSDLGLEALTIICDNRALTGFDDHIYSVFKDHTALILNKVFRVVEDNDSLSLVLIFARYGLKKCLELFHCSVMNSIQSVQYIQALTAEARDIHSDPTLLKLMTKEGYDWLMNIICITLNNMKLSDDSKHDLSYAVNQASYQSQRIKEVMAAHVIGNNIIKQLAPHSVTNKIRRSVSSRSVRFIYGM
ncbi:hypothetical protein OAT84_02510 [Gammaproteobacteria bacterium]|nr:hypothetical protein [Gammaproteobacteria bacterium]